MKIRKKESRVRGRVWFSLRWLLQQEILLAMSTHLAYVFCNNINLTAQEMNLVFRCKASRWYLLFAFLAGCSHFISVTMISYPNAKQESDPGKRMILLAIPDCAPSLWGHRGMVMSQQLPHSSLFPMLMLSEPTPMKCCLPIHSGFTHLSSLPDS